MSSTIALIAVLVMACARLKTLWLSMIMMIPR
jgi:hypothetical protein